MTTTLEDIFERLQYGELSQLHVGEHCCGDGISEDAAKKLLPHIEMGLGALYRRFRLREEKLIVTLLSNRTNYILDPKYVHGYIPPLGTINVYTGPKYITDMEKGLDNSLLKIESIWSMGTEFYKELLLNKTAHECSFRTPKFNEINVPEKVHELTVDAFEVRYRAGHPKLDKYVAPSAPMTVEIELPEAYIEALLFYVASRLHNPIGMTNQFHMGNTYYAKYEDTCQRLESQGYEIDNLGTMPKFTERGFI